MKLSCNLNRLIHWKENITWKEIIMLLIITVSMFRPDFVLNRIYPEYTEFNKDFNEQILYEEQRKITLKLS